MKALSTLFSLFLSLPLVAQAHPTQRQFSGIFPHLSYFNREDECGTGAVVPWADRLWFLTYGPHLPMGSSDKLYELTPELELIQRPESVGGTHANRMIHEASQQLILGSYFVDKNRKVRVIEPKKMPGRLTGTSQHLLDPKNKVYFATMEEGLYEVDVNTLAVQEFIRDGNGNKGQQVDHPSNLHSQLPGYHGKGLYTAQDRLIYANNGDRDKRVTTDPTTPSGALAEWLGKGDWKLVRRNQFTEVSGPDGIHPKTKSDAPVWSLGWDHRSLILMCLDQGKWHSYRLPKGSHAYDGAHGWNTEWPRIRDIGEESLLMTMHGNFWKFPKNFSATQTSGIAPRSAYLKVVGDFAKWHDWVVLGCDDSAKKEFLNTRPAKGHLPGPTLSHSNLWFLKPEQLDDLGPVLNTGSVWLEDSVQAYQASDPMLISGFGIRSLLISHQASEDLTFTLEYDVKGNGEWTQDQSVLVPKGKAVNVSLTTLAPWLRLRSAHDAKGVTATFIGKNPQTRTTDPHPKFKGLAEAPTIERHEAYVYAGGSESPTLQVLMKEAVYELSGDLKFTKKEDPKLHQELSKSLQVPSGVIHEEESSFLLVDGRGRRFRFPRANTASSPSSKAFPPRICREVCTERDLFHVGGIFYELPAENADGFRQIRPIASHPYQINDYASWRGLLVLTGVDPSVENSDHMLRSEDGKCSVWLGAVDDLWKLGKPVGKGGPWFNSTVKANAPSDPYLMHGFDRKELTLEHQHSNEVKFKMQINMGHEEWLTVQTISVKPKSRFVQPLDAHFNAKWIRFVSDQDCVATAQLKYD